MSRLEILEQNICSTDDIAVDKNNHTCETFKTPVFFCVVQLSLVLNRKIQLYHIYALTIV